VAQRSEDIGSGAAGEGEGENTDSDKTGKEVKYKLICRFGLLLGKIEIRRSMNSGIATRSDLSRAARSDYSSWTLQHTESNEHNPTHSRQDSERFLGKVKTHRHTKCDVEKRGEATAARSKASPDSGYDAWQRRAGRRAG